MGSQLGEKKVLVAALYLREVLRLGLLVLADTVTDRSALQLVIIEC